MLVKVVGVTFENRQMIISSMIGNERVYLVPEPKNPYDANAIAVYVEFPDESKEQIGYLSRQIAAHYASKLRGISLEVELAALLGGFEIEPGDYANFGVLLRIPRISEIGSYAPGLGGRSGLTGSEPGISAVYKNPDRKPIRWRCTCGKIRSDYIEVVAEPMCFDCGELYSWDNVLSHRLD